MYRVICKFADLHDNDHIYEIGDTYPREGIDVTENRINELASSGNKIRKPLIEKVITKKAPKKVADDPMEDDRK